MMVGLFIVDYRLSNTGRAFIWRMFWASL